ncbi:hypothetical protein X943_001257 [Babesia divergens]|uniref:Signal recognition particle 14 kDa protein n=1 Tax=Babesia divergens TaxID=32595 RepID=A0AAD9LHT2_BABDI|nr:hypothetical protein X943_001257 [Babesia divergens]
MVLLDEDEFIKQLTAMVMADAENAAKSLWISYKRYIPNSRSWRNRKKAQEEYNAEAADPVCLVRARLGDCKISTHVPSSLMESFSAAMNNISELMKLQNETAET